MITPDVLNRANHDLLDRAERLLDIGLGNSAARMFEVSEFRDEGFGRGLVSGWAREILEPNRDKQPVVYKVSCGDVATRDLVMNCFDSVRETADYKVPQLNPAHRTPENLVCYVGSSHSIGDRMREHLQKAPAKTYALNMGRWCRGRHGFVRVELHALLEEPFSKTVQDLEDALWDIERPILGRRGGR